jgi:hypothetical protein
MRTHCLNYLVFIGVLAFSSCATILNRKTTSVHVFTNIPAKITLPASTSNVEVTSSDFAVKRSKSPLTITAYNDTVSKIVSIKPGNSFAFWFNLYNLPYGLIGFLVDWKNPKRYTYPRNIYLDLTNRDSTYERLIPIPEEFQKYHYILSLTPLKIIDASNPALEITGEKKLSSSLSGDLMFGYLLPGNKSIGSGNNVAPKTKGITSGLELKWFTHHSAPQGFYMALGFDYLVNSYHAAANFNHTLPDSTYPPMPYNYTDTFMIHKQTYTINMMIGYQRIFKRFSINVFGGLGVRFKNVVHTGRKFPDDNLSFFRNFFGINYSYLKNQEGKYSALSVPLNIRIGWTF